jgi:hypothetical protein
MVGLSKAMEKILDVAEEKDPDIVKNFKAIAKDNDVFLSLIASYVGVKVTPSKVIMASLGLSEEFGAETVIEEIKECNSDCTTLYLLINSPGGLVQSSYKIARALRKNFKNIIVFVPHVAASGGTLVALIGNKIVMGMMSQLTPLDPHDDNGISVLSVVRGFEHVTDFFNKTSEKDAPYTYKVLAEKYDAVQIDACIQTMELMKKYISEILKETGYGKEEIKVISEKLVEGFFTHGDVINFDVAKEIGLKVAEYKEFQKHWEIFRQWLGKYILQSADRHIIRYWINNKKPTKIQEVKRDAQKKGEK